MVDGTLICLETVSEVYITMKYIFIEIGSLVSFRKENKIKMYELPSFCLYFISLERYYVSEYQLCKGLNIDLIVLCSKANKVCEMTNIGL